jgi:hypothetical protein
VEVWAVGRSRAGMLAVDGPQGDAPKVASAFRCVIGGFDVRPGPRIDDLESAERVPMPSAYR